MKVARTIAEFRALVEDQASPRIGFVPTMGALHRGHLSLVDLARDAADLLVASVFVNPLQFGVGEDLDRYPRDEAGDLARLEDAGVGITFLPSVEEMYPEGTEVRVAVGRLGTILEGAHRPGHFDGVATVVAKLFNIVRPSVAVFGQKDAQQVAVVRQLIGDLDYDIELLVGPTVREEDGLALSSRNAYLSPTERTRARALYRALEAGSDSLRGGGGPDAAEVSARRILDAEPGIETDYVAAVDPATFERPGPSGPVLVAVAAWVGKTRLIDNVACPGSEVR